MSRAEQPGPRRTARPRLRTHARARMGSSGLRGYRRSALGRPAHPATYQVRSFPSASPRITSCRVACDDRRVIAVAFTSHPGRPWDKGPAGSDGQQSMGRRCGAGGIGSRFSSRSVLALGCAAADRDLLARHQQRASLDAADRANSTIQSARRTNVRSGIRTVTNPRSCPAHDHHRRRTCRLATYAPFWNPTGVLLPGPPVPSHLGSGGATGSGWPRRSVSNDDVASG